MKKVNCIKFVMILFLSSVLNSFANTNVPLLSNLTGDIGSAIKPIKPFSLKSTTISSSCSFQLRLNDDCTALEFFSTNAYVRANYTIVDENDQEVLCGDICLNEQGVDIIDIFSLPVGAYKINMVVNGVTLYGEFDI